MSEDEKKAFDAIAEALRNANNKVTEDLLANEPVGSERWLQASFYKECYSPMGEWVAKQLERLESDPIANEVNLATVIKVMGMQIGAILGALAAHVTKPGKTHEVIHTILNALHAEMHIAADRVENKNKSTLADELNKIFGADMDGRNVSVYVPKKDEKDIWG